MALSPRKIIGRKHIHLEKVSSTNAFAQKIIRDTVSLDGTIIIADHQVEGKGQQNKKWLSDRGSNLTFSLILEPQNLFVENQFQLHCLASLACINAMRKHIPGAPLKIKWPNDIYLEDEKLGGILIQTTLVGKKIKNAILGIGINLNQTVFDASLPNPVSLKNYSGNSFNNSEVLESIIDQFELYYDKLNSETPMISDYNDLLYKKDELVTFLYKGEQMQGQVHFVDESGQLNMEMEGNIRKYTFGEIIFNFH